MCEFLIISLASWFTTKPSVSACSEYLAKPTLILNKLWLAFATPCNDHEHTSLGSVQAFQTTHAVVVICVCTAGCVHLFTLLMQHM